MGKQMSSNSGKQSKQNSKSWNQPKSGNKQGKQGAVSNNRPFRSGKGDKFERREEEIADTQRKETLSESNPLSYYTKFTKFAEDAANLPFALPVGTPVTYHYAAKYFNWAVPGIMRLVFTPTIGISTDFTSPINRSSTRFYTYLRANQKASAAYDHQDITMMELALDSAYMFHAMCSRIYETATNVTPMNEYYVRSLLAAQGVSLTDVSANMQDFRGWINSFGYNLGQFSMPAGITMFDRHRWMCSNYYVDGTSSRAQTYIHVPHGFWQYNNTVETGSQLDFVTYVKAPGQGNSQYTVAQLMQMGNGLLNAIAGDEDFQYIAGDIYNFYGGDVYAVPYIEENSAVLPVYDEVVLSQIENATIVGPWKDGLVVTQNPSVNQGAILFNPIPTYHGFSDRVPMNFHHDSPSSGDVIEASRLTVSFKPDATHGYVIDSCATEVVNWLNIFHLNPATMAPRDNAIQEQVTGVIPTGGTSSVPVFQDILALAQFDWAPGVWIVDQEDGHYYMVGQTWDVENFQMVDDNYLRWIHEACLWSLFEVGTNRVNLEGENK